MLFSVIVSIYNIQQFLTQCIESILNQSFKDFELILIDDGSTDNSGKICDEYALKDSRIKVIHKENEGQTSARLLGSQCSVGKYIVVIDGDDWIDLQYLENFKEAIDKTNADIICCGMLLINATKKKIYPYNLTVGYYNKENIKKTIFPNLIRNDSGKYLSPSLCSKAFKRDLYISIQKKINKKIKRGEDACLVYSCISNSKSIYVSDKNYYFYRMNQNSTLRSIKKGFPWEDIKYVRESFLENLNQTEYNFLPQIDRYLCHSLFNIAISHLKTNFKYKEVKKQIIDYLKLRENKNYLKSAKFKVLSKDFFVQKIMKYHQIWLLKLYVIWFNILKTNKKL